MKPYVALVLLVCLLTGCGGEATPTPDAVATQVAVMEAAAATLTARAPTSVPTVVSPTQSPAATLTAEVPVFTSPLVTPTKSTVRTPTSTPASGATAALCRKPEGWVTYTVQRGDTLAQLAAACRTTVKRLKDANCLRDETVYAGTTLWLPFRPPSSPTATRRPTRTPTDASATAQAVTSSPVPPTNTPARPTATRTAPPVGPSLGQFAVVRVASNDLLNVRSGPGTAYPVVDTIPYHGLDVEVHAGAREVDGSWWVPVEYEGVTGWVNSRYLARQAGWVSEPIAARAAQIIMILKDGDLEALAERVHPEKGVRFSPYTYVRAVPGAPEEEDLVFRAAQIPGLASDPTVYHWGRFDGSGEPIDLTFAGYYDRFIYDANFAAPDIIGFAETIGRGNTINNISDVYPQAVTVEYHFEGIDPQYAGLDWRSLRLVLEELNGTWYLVGIVHDEWTI